MKLDLLEHENILFDSAASPYQVEVVVSSSRLTSRLSQSLELGWCMYFTTKSPDMLQLHPPVYGIDLLKYADQAGLPAFWR